MVIKGKTDEGQDIVFDISKAIAVEAGTRGYSYVRTANTNALTIAEPSYESLADSFYAANKD